MRISSFTRGASWSFLGSLVLVLSQWAILTVFARVGTAATVGDYTWALAVTAPIIILANLALRDVLVTDAGYETGIEVFLWLRFLSSAAGVLVIVLGMVASGQPASTTILVTVVAVTKAIEAQSDIIHGVYQREDRLRLVATSMVIRSTIQVFVALAVFAVTDSLIGAALAIALVSGTILLLYDTPRLRSFRRREEGAAAGRPVKRRRDALLWLAWHSLPLGMAAALISLNVNVIRFFIGTVRSSTELGIYAVLSYPLVAGNLVIAAVSTASLARLAKHAAHNEYDAFGHMLVKLVGIAIAFAIAAVGLGWVLGAFLLELLVGAEYAAHNSVFRVLLLGMGIGFVNWFLNSALTASKQFRLALALQVASLLLTVGLGWWFIDRWSIEGAAWATVIVLGANVIAKGVLLARFVAAGTRRATAFATPVRAGERRLA